MSAVTPDDVRKVAQLARHQLSQDAVATFTTQLDHIVEYVRQLQAVPTEGIEPTSHVVPLANVTRPDVQTDAPPLEDMMRIPPARHGQLIQVPKVVEQSV